jgi:hypothetical protein
VKEVLFVDGRRELVDADMILTPAGGVLLLKRVRGEANQVVRRYPAGVVRNVNAYTAPPIKVLGIKLYTACNHVPHGSKKLAELAGIEYSDMVIPILKKLRDAGKVVFTEGKWVRA